MSDDILRSTGILRVYELTTNRSSSSVLIKGMLKTVKAYGGRRILQCPDPGHPDEHPSCLINEDTNTWHCLARGNGGTMLDMIKACIPRTELFGSLGAGSDTASDPRAENRAAIAWLKVKIHAPQNGELAPQPPPDKRFADGKWVRLQNERLTDTFAYRDRHGIVRYQVLRFDGIDDDGARAKRFLQRRPLPGTGKWIETATDFSFVTPDDRVHSRLSKMRADGHPRAFPTMRWANNLDGVERLPFGLPELIAGASAGGIVDVFEGEGKVKRTRALGLISTTNSEGAAFDYFEHREAWLPYFAGARAIYVWGDNDDTGQHAAIMRARALAPAAPLVVAINGWPDERRKYDVDDFLKGLPRMHNAQRREELEAARRAAFSRPLWISTDS